MHRRLIDQRNVQHLDLFHPWIVRMMQHAESLVAKSRRLALVQALHLDLHPTQHCIPIYRDQEMMLYDSMSDCVLCKGVDIIWRGSIADGSITMRNKYNESLYTIDFEGNLTVFRPKHFHKDSLPPPQTHLDHCDHVDTSVCEFVITQDIEIHLLCSHLCIFE